MSASSSSPSSWQLQKGQLKENKLVNEQRREGRSTWKNAGVHIHKNLSMFSCSYPCFLVDTLVFLAHSPVFFSVCVGGVGMHVSLSLQPHLKLLQSLIRCMSSHLFCFHTSSTLKWNSAPVPTLKHIRGKAYCIFMNSIEGGWSRHNDRACEGRNGASKLVSDWE